METVDLAAVAAADTAEAAATASAREVVSTPLDQTVPALVAAKVEPGPDMAEAMALAQPLAGAGAV